MEKSDEPKKNTIFFDLIILLLGIFFFCLATFNLLKTLDKNARINFQYNERYNFLDSEYIIRFPLIEKGRFTNQ